jgi:hypothetical protein
MDGIDKQKNQFIQQINDLDNDKLSKLIECYNKMVKDKDKEKPVEDKNQNNTTNKTKTKAKTKPIDKTTQKYKLLLQYVNGILKNINKPLIDDIIEFKDIDRLDIIKPENIKLLDTLAPSLFNYFNKDKCGYYRKTKNLPLNVLRGCCKELGLELVNRKVSKTETKATFGTHYLYSIV